LKNYLKRENLEETGKGEEVSVNKAEMR